MVRQEIAKEGPTRVFVYWAVGLWYDWNHRCSLSLLCCAAGSAQCPHCTSHSREAQTCLFCSPGFCADETLETKYLPCPQAERVRTFVWEWDLKVRFGEDIRINSDEPSLFRCVRRVFLSSSFSVSSGILSLSFCWPGRSMWGTKFSWTAASVPLETFDPGLSEIPPLPLSHKTKRQPCFSNCGLDFWHRLCTGGSWKSLRWWCWAPPQNLPCAHAISWKTAVTAGTSQIVFLFFVVLNRP